MTETTENNDSDKVQMNVEQTRKLRRSGSSSTLIISVDKGIKETYGLEPGQMV